MPEMGVGLDIISAISDGRKVVAAAGTAETLVAASTSCRFVILTALSTNTGIVAVGGSTVVAAAATRRGAALSAGDSVGIPIDDLIKIYLDAVVSGEGVSYMFLS